MFAGPPLAAHKTDAVLAAATGTFTRSFCWDHSGSDFVVVPYDADAATQPLKKGQSGNKWPVEPPKGWLDRNGFRPRLRRE